MNELTKMGRGIFMKAILAFTFCLIGGTWAFGQQDDPVLFEVDGVPVHVSEFTYIYSKTNGKNADFSRKSLDEYLNLYVKFKLKVRKAKEMRLDTIKALQEELAGYRKQLADSYLLDKTVKRDLAKEVHDRLKKDVDLSHIFVSYGPNPLPKDTLTAYEKAMAIKKRLQGGADFEALAKEASDDKLAKKNGGRIGYITAMFPNGMYNLETAAYEGKSKKFLGPVRTNGGYHIVRVNDRRPAYGEVEISHLLIRNNEANPAEAKRRIDSLYQAIEKGGSFDQLASKYSEDSQTKSKEGYIGFIGIKRFAPVFEEAMFSIKKDGGYSQPIKSNVGWHIIKRITRPGIQPFEMERSRLEAAISKDSRLELAKKKMLAKIKKESKYRENTTIYNKFVESLNDTFLTFRWRPTITNSKDALFTLGKTFKPTVGEFNEYLMRSARDRMRMAKMGDVKVVARSLFDSFVDEQVLKYEESQLDIKNPAFKALMREYEEGILLFEATKMLVWDKASQDTTGLEKYFTKIDGKYKWKERANTTIYRLSKQYESQAASIYAYAKDHTAQEVKAKFNSDGKIIVNAEEKMLEKGRHPELNRVEWVPNSMSNISTNDKNNTITFHRLLELIPPSNKTLKEARGYVVADYQDHLEREWIKELREAYDVKINDKVYENLIKE